MTTTKERSTWRYLDLSDYAAPVAATSEALRDRLKSTWQRLFADRGSATPVREFDHLRPESEAALISEPSWDECIDVLGEALERQAAGGAERSMVVGPPGGGVTAVLTRWAEREEFDVLAPPEPASLLDEDLKLPRRNLRRPLVIPELHGFFLRHPAGLNACRELMQAVRGSRRRIVLGCDSWAWAYLCKSVQVDALVPPPLAPGPWNGPDVRAWLSSRLGGGQAELDFRFAADARPVFRAGNAGGDDSDVDGFFQELAATARGIPQVALTLWNNSLASVREQGQGDGTHRNRTTERELVWVRAPADCKLPLVPANLDRLDAIVLHSLLLHAGLPEDVLHRLLPFDDARVTRSLFSLRRLALVEESEGFWSVPVLAYPNVRAYLCDEGFLVDAF